MKIHPKMRNPGMKEFSSISNEILKGIHIKGNPSRNEKSRNEGILFNFQLHVKKEVIQRKIHPKMREIRE